MTDLMQIEPLAQAPTNSQLAEMLNEFQSLNLKGLEDAAIAIQQPRSQFLLEHFVVGQHPTTLHQWKQCVLELVSKFNLIRRHLIQRKINGIQAEKLRASTDEVKQLRARLVDISIEESDLALLGAIQEFKCLYKIWRSFGAKQPTAEELEQNEKDYWFARLSGQANLDLASRQTGIGYGNLQALEQAKFLQIRGVGDGSVQLGPPENATRVNPTVIDDPLGTQVVIG